MHKPIGSSCFVEFTFIPPAQLSLKTPSDLDTLAMSSILQHSAGETF